MPHLIELYRKYQARGLQMVLVSQESIPVLRTFAEAQEIPFPILSDPQGIAFGPYQAREIPRTVLVNREGNIAAILPGYNEDAFTKQFVPMVEKALGLPQTARGGSALLKHGDTEARRMNTEEDNGGTSRQSEAASASITPCLRASVFQPSSTRPGCRGVFGSPQPLWDRGMTLGEAGIDAVFVGHKELSEELVARCRREGARVYAEFGIFQGKKVAEARPELWPVGADGKRLEPEGWYLGLCPDQPAYRKEKLAELAETARKYAIDGVWLDFIRYPGHWEVRAPRLQQSCFCDASLARFARAVRLTLPEGDTAARAGWILREHAGAWTRWKCAQIASFARDARRVLKAARPNALLGLFAVPWRPEERDGAIHAILGQDHALLARHVDVFSPMAYHRMVGRPVSWVGEIAADQRARTGKTVWPILQAVDAPPGETLPAEELTAALHEAFARGDGALVFTLPALLERPEKLAAVTRIYRSRGDADLVN